MTATPSSGCPSPELLANFLAGRIGQASLDQIGAHVTGCASCTAELSRSQLHDPFLSAIHEAAAHDIEISPQWQLLIDELGQLPTRQLESVVTRASTSRECTAALDLSQLLEPAQNEGELGRLDHFRVLKVLGQGGMGVVLQAHDTELDRLVALKIMLPQVPARPDLARRFEQEARVLAAIHSDHVVKVFAVGRADTPAGPVPYLAMELLAGENLSDRLLSGAMPVPEIMTIAQQMVSGLIAVHAQNVVHRDLKPSNVWLQWLGREAMPTSGHSSPERAKLLDFGLARVEQRPSDLSQAGHAMGTPAYMSPEQAAGATTGPRSDLFSLGAVLYEMATGRQAFSGAHTAAVVTSVVQATPIEPAAFNPTLPRRLCRLIQRLLSKTPGLRPASALEVLHELLEIERELTQPVPRATASPITWPTLLLMLGVFLSGGALWYSQVVRIETPNGTLVIDRQVPDVALRITHNGTTLIDRTTRQKLKLEVGEYGVQLVDAPQGIKLSADRITITREGQPIVRIYREPPTVASEIVKQDSAPLQPTQSNSEKPGGPTIPRTSSGLPAPAHAPFDAQTASELQAAWSAVLNEPLTVSNSLKMPLALIPPGSFQDASIPARCGTPLRMGIHEVTRGQFYAVLQRNPDGSHESPAQPDWPASGVSRSDAVEFCRRLSDTPAERSAGWLYDLPNQAEWEWAARAGRVESLPGPAASARDYARFREQQPSRVGSYAPNAFGLYDVHGNVSEWSADLEPAPGDQAARDWTGLQNVSRGGSYDATTPELIAVTAQVTAGTERQARPDQGLRVVARHRKTLESAVSSSPAEPADAAFVPMMPPNSWAGWGYYRNVENLDGVFHQFTQLPDQKVSSVWYDGTLRGDRATYGWEDFELRGEVKSEGDEPRLELYFRANVMLVGWGDGSFYRLRLSGSDFGALNRQSEGHVTLVAAPASTQAVTIRPEVWNTFILRAEGPRIRLWINDQLACDYQEQLAHACQKGTFSFNLDVAPSQAWFRHLRLHRMPPAGANSLKHPVPPPSAGFESLPNGRNLAGLLRVPLDDTHWRAADGELLNDLQAGALLSEYAKYENFHVKTELKLSSDAAVRLLMRVAPFEKSLSEHPPEWKGYVCQINSATGKDHPPGAIYHLNDPATPQLVSPPARDDIVITPDEWLTWEAIVRSHRYRILINGIEVQNWEDPQQRFSIGRIGLQKLTADGKVTVRRWEVRELTEQ